MMFGIGTVFATRNAANGWRVGRLGWMSWADFAFAAAVSNYAGTYASTTMFGNH